VGKIVRIKPDTDFKTYHRIDGIPGAGKIKIHKKNSDEICPLEHTYGSDKMVMVFWALAAYESLLNVMLLFAAFIESRPTGYGF